jgi:hypothetical protein
MFLFADDTNALSKNDDLPALIDSVNIELKKLAAWFKANKLVINTSKTKFMIFRTKNRVVNLQNKNVYIDFNNYQPALKVNLSRVHNNGSSENQTYKLLGVLFDEYLSFNQHVSYVHSKISRSLFLLNRSKHFLTKYALRLLYFATVHSHLLYCPIILSIACKTQLNRLIVLQKMAVRILYGAAYNAHTAPIFHECRILPLDLIVIQAKLKLMHSIKYEYCPRSFLNMFIRNNVENANYDLRYPNDFAVPRARIELFKKIPAYTLPTEWNNCEDLQKGSIVIPQHLT